MPSLKYLTPEEIKNQKNFVQNSLETGGGSPVVKSGFALKTLSDFVSDKKSKILDCGSGAGSFLAMAHEKGYDNLFVVDIDNYLLFKQVKEFKPADLSFERIPWDDNFFDVATAWQMMEHLENPHNFMREAHRVLKPEGLFLMSMPNIQHIFNRLFFLRKGDMFRWNRRNNHIALFPKGLFQKTFLKYFDIVEERFTEGEFPYRFLSKIKFPNNKWFGRDVVYIFKNKK